MSSAPILLGTIDGYPALGHPDITGRAMVVNRHRVSYGPMAWNADHATSALGITIRTAPRAYTHVIPIWTASDKAVWWTAYGRRSALSGAYSYFASAGVKCVNRELNSARSSAVGMEAIWGSTAELDLVAKYNQYVHVQAAGNQGLPIANQPYYKPAHTLDHLLIVVAVDSNRVWPLSNTPQGRCLYAPGVRPIPDANLLHRMTVSAPGVMLRVPVSPSGYGYASGTSFAAPYVQGTVALMYERAAAMGKPMTPQVCARIIKETCTKIGPPEIFGHGLVNADAAVEAVR